MKRRRFIALVATCVGGLAVGGGLLVAGARRNPRLPAGVPEEDLLRRNVPLLNDIAQVILPATDSPGAGDVGVGQAIMDIVMNCFNAEERDMFIAGLLAIEAKSVGTFGSGFGKLATAHQQELLRRLDLEQRLHRRLRAVRTRMRSYFGSPGARLGDLISPDTTPHYFSRIKEMVVLTYFTSRVGATQALRYVAVPGRYDGAVLLGTGGKSWATY